MASLATPLPVTLTYGLMAVYGQGYSYWGIDDTVTGSTNQWGIISQIDSAPAQLAIGANVLYDKNDVVSELNYVYSGLFNILPWNKVIAIENPLT